MSVCTWLIFKKGGDHRNFSFYRLCDFGRGFDWVLMLCYFVYINFVFLIFFLEIIWEECEYFDKIYFSWLYLYKGVCDDSEF